MLLSTSCAPYTPYTVNQSLIAYNNMSPSPIPYTIADAFTNKPFSGNPAAVIVLRNGLQLADSTSRLIARELNLSETALVTPKPDDDAAGSASLTFGLRWFTPRVEVTRALRPRNPRGRTRPLRGPRPRSAGCRGAALRDAQGGRPRCPSCADRRRIPDALPSGHDGESGRRGS